jgi:hypothetical protein
MKQNPFLMQPWKALRILLSVGYAVLVPLEIVNPKGLKWWEIALQVAVVVSVWFWPWYHQSHTNRARAEQQR